MLCRLARSMPLHIARLLERDVGLTRNFREETITDVLMAGFVGLGGLQIRVDFPDETKTGADMEWIFIGPGTPKGVRCLRLLLQAKRASHLPSSGGYWLYKHLDHLKGQQASVLMGQKTLPNPPIPTVPLYIFYNPTSALTHKTDKLPAVEGVNIVFAQDIVTAVAGGCGNKSKKMEKWRPQFMSLSDVICWPSIISPKQRKPFALSLSTGLLDYIRLSGGYHPDILVERLRRFAEIVQSSRTKEGRDEYPNIEIPDPSDDVPLEILRAIGGKDTDEDRRAIRRPRLIFNTDLSAAAAKGRTLQRDG